MFDKKVGRGQPSCFSRKARKRGISAVVATVLIILITVSAVAIIWVAIIPMIRDNLEIGTVCLEADVIVDSSSGYTCYDAEKKILAVRVKKGPNEVDIAEIELLLASGGTSSKMSMPFDLGINEGKIFYFPVDENIDEVSIAPVIQIGNSERTCDVTTRVSLASLKNCSLSSVDARSCLAWFNEGQGEDGLYWIDPDGGGGEDIFQVYCDMTTDDGGWTVVAAANIEINSWYPDLSSTEVPTTIPTDETYSRIYTWPKYTEYMTRTIYSDHFDGTTTDRTAGPKDTGIYGEVECNIIDFYIDNANYQNGKCTDAMVGSWTDCNPNPNYDGYDWFGTYCNTYYFFGQHDLMGHVVSSDIYRLNGSSSRWISIDGCGTGWANNACREGKDSYTKQDQLSQKLVLMVR